MSGAALRLDNPVDIPPLRRSKPAMIDNTSVFVCEVTKQKGGRTDWFAVENLRVLGPYTTAVELLAAMEDTHAK
jgi:hypothetical protein